MCLTATALPGATFSANVWTIPLTALNAVLANDMTGTVDSFERLVYGLLQVVQERQAAGQLTAPTIAMSIDNKQITSSVYETTTNNFVPVQLVSFLSSFAFTNTTTIENGNSIVAL
jgi:hypothetical protein